MSHAFGSEEAKSKHLPTDYAVRRDIWRGIGQVCMTTDTADAIAIRIRLTANSFPTM